MQEICVYIDLRIYNNVHIYYIQYFEDRSKTNGYISHYIYHFFLPYFSIGPQNLFWLSSILDTQWDFSPTL